MDIISFRYSAQTMFLHACVVIFDSGGFLFFPEHYLWVKNRMNTTELSRSDNWNSGSQYCGNSVLMITCRVSWKATPANSLLYQCVAHDFRTPLALICRPYQPVMGLMGERTGCWNCAEKRPDFIRD